MANIFDTLYGNSQSTTSSAPDIIKAAITDLLTRAATQSIQPYPQYTPDTAASYANYVPGLVAAMTPDQVAAGQTIAGLKGYTTPYFNQATGMALNATSPLQRQQFSQGAVNQYMSPYLNNVVGAATANINQTNAQQQQQVLGNAMQRGAFGGDRAGIAQAELTRQQNLSNNATISNLLNQGYSQALQEFNQQQGVDLATQAQNRALLYQGANQMANLGTQGQQAALQQAGAQYGYGNAAQQQNQMGLSTAYQQYLNQQMWPYQQLNYLSGVLSGAAPAMGGTTTVNSPTSTLAGGIMGTLGALGTIGGGSSSTNPFLSAIAGLSAIFKDGGRVEHADGGGVHYADGGRTHYADAGAVSVSPVTQAYNDYVNAISSGASFPILQQLYQKYQKSLQGAEAPWDKTTTNPSPSPTPTPSPTLTPAVTSTPEINRGPNRDATSVTGGNRGEGASDYNALGDQTGLDRFGGSGTRRGLNLGNFGREVMGRVDPVTGVQTGILGAFDALKHGNSPGTYNKIGTATNMVADPSQGGREMPNTASGMTAQQWADKFTGGDLSKVGAGFTSVNGQQQIDFFNLDNGAAKALHFGYVPATQLDASLLGKPAVTDENQSLTDPLAGGADLATKSSSGVVSNAAPSNDYFGGLLQRESGGQQFNPDGTVKIGSSGEIGMGQIKPSTAEEVAAKHGIAYSLDKLNNDPEYNKTLSGLYFQDQFDRFGTPELGLAAYNAGPGAVSKSLRTGSQLPASTQDYVSSIMANNPDAAMRPVPGMVPSPPTNPDYSAALSDIQNSKASDEGIGGVGAASEGHGGSQRDTSGDRAGLYDQPAGPDMPDNMADGMDTSGAPQAGSDNSGEKRGGRIHPHHFADGGATAAQKGLSFYKPISMQYGMADQNALQQMISDLVGSGVGDITPQNQAIAAQGLLPSATAANGGRIGYANLPNGSGAVESDDDFNLAGNASLNELNPYSQKVPRLPSLDASPDNPNALTLQDNSLPLSQQSPDEIRATADTAADKLKKGESRTPIGRRFQSVFEPSGVAGGTTTKSKEQVSDQIFQDLMRAQRAQRRQEDAAATESQVQQVKKQAPSMLDPMSEAEYQEKQQTNEARIAALQNKLPGVGAGTPTAAYEPSVTYEPAGPGVGATTEGHAPKEKVDLSSFSVPSGVVSEPVTAEGNQFAPQTTTAAVEGNQRVAPGIKEWYNAPPPRDISTMNNLAFFGTLMGGGFGPQLANAANNYARGMIAQQGQERLSMTDQASAAHNRAQTGQSEAETTLKKIIDYGLGKAVVNGTGEAGSPISIQALPPSMEGGETYTVGGNKTYSSDGTLVQNGKPIQGTANKFNWAGQTYVPEVEGGPSQQEAHNVILELAKQARQQMPANTLLAEKNYADMKQEQKIYSKQADAENNAKITNDEVTKALAAYPMGGPRSAGKGGVVAANIISGFNSAARRILNIDLGLNEYVSSTELLKKIQTATAQATDPNSAAAWKEYIRETLPSIELSDPANRTLAANAYVKQFKANNMARFAATYVPASLGQGPSIEQTFSSIKGNDPQTYSKLVGAVSDLMNAHEWVETTDPVTGKKTQDWKKDPKTGRYENMVTMFLDGRVSPEEFNKEAYRITGVKNMAAVIGGGSYGK